MNLGNDHVKGADRLRRDRLVKEMSLELGGKLIWQ